MNEALSLAGLLIAVFGVSYALAAVALRPRETAVAFNLVAGEAVRIVTPDGSYRCRVVSFGTKGLVTTAPIFRDHYVPLRPGLEVFVQAPCPEGLATFRSTILRRDKDEREFLLAAPTQVRYSERRSEPRSRRVEGEYATLNGESARLVDLSAHGAKVVTTADVAPGDLVTVELPKAAGTAVGWALETRPASLRDRRAVEVRVRFDGPLGGLL